MNFDGVWWLRDGADTSDEMKTNIPHRVKHHSPTGMNVGYGGSGPADFALNILQYRLEQLGYNGQRTNKNWSKQEMFADVWDVYQAFKSLVLVDADRLQGNLSWGAVDGFFRLCMNPNIMNFMISLPYVEHHICDPQKFEDVEENWQDENDEGYPLYLCPECWEYHVKQGEQFTPLAVMERPYDQR